MACVIELRNRKREVVAHALIDESETERVIGHSWCLGRNGYAQSRINGRLWYLHRWILCDPDGQTDHINRDKLDCRRSNLRVVNNLQNHQNVPGRGGTSKYRGVYWNTQAQRWTAAFGCRTGRRHRKSFRTEEEAARYIRAWRLEHLPFTVEDVDQCIPTI